MRRVHTRALPVLTAAAAAGALSVLAFGAAPAGASAPSAAQTLKPSAASTPSGVASVPVSFRVRNVNRSAFRCASDGRTYTVRGHLVGPAAQLRSPSAGVTLYLHGLNFGQFFWTFNAVPGYDYANIQAAHGLTSVVIDRLGYGSSGKPNGFQICAGSRADIAHQIVQDLRSGNYTTAGRPAPRFATVALAGHSYGGQIAELEAYSFGGINALAIISYTDQGFSPLAKSSAAYSARVCARGGMPVRPGGPGGYAPFGRPAGARAALFNDVAPSVYAAARPMLTLNPCGDMVPFAKVAQVNLSHLKDITVPVLVVSGGADALFPPTAARRQAALFTGSRRVDQVTVPDAAHAITLERPRLLFAKDVRSWLRSTPVS